MDVVCANSTKPVTVTAGFIKWQQFNLLHPILSKEDMNRTFAEPKLIKSRKPCFPDMVIHIYKTV